MVNVVILQTFIYTKSQGLLGWMAGSVAVALGITRITHAAIAMNTYTTPTSHSVKLLATMTETARVMFNIILAAI